MVEPTFAVPTKFSPSPTKFSPPQQPIALTSQSTGNRNAIKGVIGSSLNASAGSCGGLTINADHTPLGFGIPTHCQALASNKKNPKAEGAYPVISTPSKGKAVQRKTPDGLDDEGHTSNDQASDDNDKSGDEEQITPPTKAKRGRPHKDVLKEAAKRMRKY
ncbi:hypothetical protein PtA15_3A431 [Puccinia triticina]|uniref:Uncharacterized protein n=1 Tax=Puccinia triticina TaxID=208348 RepID=A0ABY7CED6_9BASI|nr:uncharacterized protein PtA15_3A431 [Puccinia triticina]WAQ83064.1 hypothetical protein PtA15_3A431 [Puccinia triticina]WAR53898.1 hypothetical protein PtB15_3B407 [Puccinia triticina]